MKQHQNSLLAVFFIAFLAAITTGCKENTIIDSRVLPIDSNVVEMADSTFPLQTKTVYDSNVITSAVFPGIPTNQALGVINSDPYFGNTSASMFFQVIPNTLGFSFVDNNYTIDSAVLILPYSGYSYGDSSSTSVTQTYQVYRVSDSLSTDSTYYAYTNKNVSQSFSDPVTVNLSSLKDSVSVNGINVAPHLRIKLNNDFINLFNTASASNFTDYPTFLSWFKGLCVVPVASSQSSQTLPYFTLDGTDQYTEANVVIYYHDANGIDTSTNLFFNSQYCAHFNRITRAYAGYQVQQLFQSAAASDDVVALQNQPGASIDIKIPNISKIPNAIINRAELDISVIPALTSLPFYGPPRLYVTGVGKTTNGADSLYTIADRYPLSSTSSFEVLDGTPYTANGITTYKINIPRELQNAVIQQKDTLHLRINGTQDYFGAYRIVAGGGNNANADYRLKFKVVYSKLK